MTLKDLRERSLLTQRQVAKDLEIDPSYYCLIENGKRKLSLDCAVKLAKLYNVDIDRVYSAYKVCRRSTSVQPKNIQASQYI